MSNEPASKPSSPPSEQAVQGTSPMRIVLFAILGLLIVALAYDFVVARPGHAGAVKRVEALISDTAGSEMISNAEPVKYEQVLEAVGTDPSSSEEGETYYMERFSWRSGLPWRSHDLYVIYTKTKQKYLHDISVGQPPEPSKFPRPATAEADAALAAAGVAVDTNQGSAAAARTEPPPRGDSGEDRSGAAAAPEETPEGEPDEGDAAASTNPADAAEPPAAEPPAADSGEGPSGGAAEEGASEEEPAASESAG